MQPVILVVLVKHRYYATSGKANSNPGSLAGRVLEKTDEMRRDVVQKRASQQGRVGLLYGCCTDRLLTTTDHPWSLNSFSVQEREEVVNFGERWTIILAIGSTGIARVLYSTPEPLSLGRTRQPTPDGRSGRPPLRPLGRMELDTGKEQDFESLNCWWLSSFQGHNCPSLVTCRQKPRIAVAGIDP